MDTYSTIFDWSIFSLDLGSAQNNLKFEWGVEFGLYGNWGGPLVDHFVTSLATLLFPLE